MIDQENPDDNSPTKISPAQRVYAFKNLPKDIRDKLLEMQNIDGDFLKISSGETERTVLLFVLWIMIFVGFAAIVADSLMALKRIVVFSIDAFVLLLWFVYLVRKLFKTLSAPIKNQIYLTPTQVFETLDGTVRYRQLKDAAEISVSKFSTDVGRRNKLEIKFDDGDAYRFYITGMTNSKQTDLMQKWREQAENWKTIAVSAFQRGDADYLKSRDIFSKLTKSNASVLERQYRTKKENLLLIITTMLFALNGAFIFFLTR